MSAHLSSHTIPFGIGGTPARVTSPAPPSLMIPDRSPDIPTVQPFFQEGDKVKALAFTGRGFTVSFSMSPVESSATAVRRLKSNRLPFRGYVRSFGYAMDSDASNIIRPIYSHTDQAADLTITTADEDRLMADHNADSTPSFPGFVSLQKGVLHVVSIDFLLPSLDVFLGLQVVNNTGSGFSVGAWMEVLEVIEKP